MRKKIKPCVLTDAPGNVDERLDIHPKIREAVHPAAVLATEDRSPGQKEFVEIAEPFVGIGMVTEQGDRGVEEVVQDVLPDVVGEQFAFLVVDILPIEMAGPGRRGLEQDPLLVFIQEFLQGVVDKRHREHDATVTKVIDPGHSLRIPTGCHHGPGDRLPGIPGITRQDIGFDQWTDRLKYRLPDPLGGILLQFLGLRLVISPDGEDLLRLGRGAAAACGVGEGNDPAGLRHLPGPRSERRQRFGIDQHPGTRLRHGGHESLSRRRIPPLRVFRDQKLMLV